jgi:hypothetical protein
MAALLLAAWVELVLVLRYYDNAILSGCLDSKCLYFVFVAP